MKFLEFRVTVSGQGCKVEIVMSHVVGSLLDCDGRDLRKRVSRKKADYIWIAVASV